MDYNNVIKFIKELGTSRLLISVSNITINKFVTQSFKQSVEVKIGLVMFSATKEDLRPLFSTTRAQFEAQMINVLGTEYIYLEDKTLEDAEEMAETEENNQAAETEEYYEEESSEDYEEEQAVMPLRHNHNLETTTPTYVELRLSPFRD
ncbi:MAG: hypothetical protein HY819_07155 [Acidobacteria bacterium]|nr:hypothetical protein [Acidobacteriota bacterium]